MKNKDILSLIISENNSYAVLNSSIYGLKYYKKYSVVSVFKNLFVWTEWAHNALFLWEEN